MTGLGLFLSVAEPRVYEPGVVTLAEADSGAAHEVLRIQRHLARVESTLREQTPPDLTPDQRAARLALMDVLHAYWVAGRFPRNRDHHDRRVPYFIDADGTPCAVGHLMIESGYARMAREIATYENFDFLSEVDHPGVGGWLQEHGLTAEEAGWIQPSYGPCGFSYETVCGSDGNNYACEVVATQCAGVDVVSFGPCGSDDGSSTGGSSTGGSSSGGSSSGGSSSGGSSGSEGGSTTGGGDPSGSSTTGGTDPEAPIIGEEICPAGFGSTGEVTDGELTDSGASDSDSTASSGQSSDSGAQSEEDPSGCRSGGGTPSILALGIFGLLGLRRRRQ